MGRLRSPGPAPVSDWNWGLWITGSSVGVKFPKVAAGRPSKVIFYKLGLSIYFYPYAPVCMLSRLNHVWLCATQWTAALQAPWDSPGKNTGVGCHTLLQGIFPTVGLSLGLPHCGQILYCLSYLGLFSMWTENRGLPKPSLSWIRNHLHWLKYVKL